MEHVTLWVPANDPHEVSVPHEVVLQMLRLRWASATEGSDWSIRIVGPEGTAPIRKEWDDAVTLEVEADRFCRDVAGIGTDSLPLHDFGPEDYVTVWRRIRAFLPEDLPDLELRDGLKEASAAGRGSPAYYRVLKEVETENVSRLRAARAKLLEALERRRNLEFVAFRFGVGDRPNSICWAWNHPGCVLSRLHLPLFAREPQLSTQDVAGRLPDLNATLVAAEDGNHAMVAGLTEDRGTFRAKIAGVPRLEVETSEAELFSPYGFVPPLIFWRGPEPISLILGRRDEDALRRLADAWDGAGRDHSRDLGVEAQALIVNTWEDVGIWDEYRRIERVVQEGERIGDLGEIAVTGRKVPVTVLTGGAGLVFWQWMREARRREAERTDVVTCPRCGKQWARAPRQHKNKICSECASLGLRQVRASRGDAPPDDAKV